MKRLGRYTLLFERRPAILGHAAVCGKKEAAGPLARDFDQTFLDSYLNQESWEKAESMLQTEAANLAIRKAGLQKQDINMVFAGGSAEPVHFEHVWSARNGHSVPWAIRGVLHDGANAHHGLHHGGMRRGELRLRGDLFPLLHRGAAIPHAAGIRQPARADCAVDGDSFGQRGARYERRHSSTARDRGAHCRSRCDRHDEHGRGDGPRCGADFAGFFNDTATKPEDYDRIYTGDLGAVGTKLLYELLRENGIVLRNHEDCGLILFDREAQDVHAGGSGCGCSAGVLCGHILNRMDRGELKNILFMATGALMSTTSSQQGESIPGIAHLVHVGRG